MEAKPCLLTNPNRDLDGTYNLRGSSRYTEYLSDTENNKRPGIRHYRGRQKVNLGHDRRFVLLDYGCNIDPRLLYPGLSLWRHQCAQYTGSCIAELQFLSVTSCHVVNIIESCIKE